MKIRHLFLFICLITISSLYSQEDYYWIGGQGNWADLNQWITSTGVTPNEVPDVNDNVIFNENSFTQTNDTVFIFLKNAECKNMIWEDLTMPVVMAGGSDTTTLSIHASLIFDTLVTNKFLGVIQFKSNNAGNIVEPGNNQFYMDIYFDGEGEWIIQDTLLVFDTTSWIDRVNNPLAENPEPNPVIYFQKGTLNTNGQIIVSEGFNSGNQNPRNLLIENSDIYIIDGSWSIDNAIGLTLQAENSHITCRGGFSNSDGEGTLVYNDVTMLALAGIMYASNIRVQMDSVYFMGDGSVEGDKDPGSEGTYTIDTLIINGFMAPASVSGVYDSINVTIFNIYGFIECDESFFRKIIYNSGGELYGLKNDVDTMLVYLNQGAVAGNNFIDYLYFQTDGAISGETGTFNFAKHAFFGGDGTFGRNNTFDTLTFSSGHWYQFQSDSLALGGANTQSFVQTVNDELKVKGTCEGGLTMLTSGYKPVQAYFDYQGSLSTEYLAVKNIINIGNEITVENGIDLLNNENFLFIDPLVSRDLYWIGGGGNWDDKDHWSLDEINGGHCPPTLLDNAYFKENAGFNPDEEVIINIKYAQCNDLIWDGAPNTPTFAGEDTNNIRLWGSLQFQDDMESEFGGKFYFDSEFDSEYETVTLAGKEFGNQTYFYGEEGMWKFEDEVINLADTLFFLWGDLHTNGQTVQAYNFNSEDSLYRKFTLDTTLFEVFQANADAWVLNGRPDKIDFYSGTSTIRSWGTLGMVPPVGLCHIRSTSAWDLEYHNIEFMNPESQLKNEGWCIYNLVDYMPASSIGEINGMATIDTVTFHEGAAGCVIKNNDTINVVMAHSLGDTITGNHHVNEAYFFKEGMVSGVNWVGQLNFYEHGTMEYTNDVDSAIFYANGLIQGSNTFDTLVFTPGNKYFLQHDDVQTINEVFDVNGSCLGPIRMQSDSIGTQASILVKQNLVEVDYTSFRDLIAVDYGGNLPYKAYHSIDLGNNEGWELVPYEANDYYWIGGKGNWGDPYHWSLESGGQPNAEQCLPRELNTVHFDDNSFINADDTVFLDVPNPSCLSMLWEHSDAWQPVFTEMDGVKSDLSIYGSLLLSSSMVYNFDGMILFDEPSSDKANDYITSNGQIILEDVHFQGINGSWTLTDSMTLFVDAQNDIFKHVYIVHGELITNGQQLYCGSIYSNIKNQRTLNIQYSDIVLNTKYVFCWYVDGDNFNLEAEYSNIIMNGDESSIRTNYGETLDFYDITINGLTDSLRNETNIANYNTIYVNGPGASVGGPSYYTTDSVIFNSTNSALVFSSFTNVVEVNANNNWVSGNHEINRGIFNKYGSISASIDKSNYFKYCIFYDNGDFWGNNTFDTLVLKPGMGNTFSFEQLKTQTIIDSLYIRGNRCGNMDIVSMNNNVLATIKMDSGIVSGDYLNLGSVAAVGENSKFYTGLNSESIVPEQAPGWIWDNAQGYIYGFGIEEGYFCPGEEYTISAVNFNGDENTLYYWNGSVIPGDITYTVTQPGTYTLLVQYTDECAIPNQIDVYYDYPPEVDIIPVRCTGDLIEAQVNPEGDNYTYKWFNDEETSSIIASLDFNGEDIWVEVTDTINGCSEIVEKNFEIHPKPNPQDYVGEDVTLIHGHTITIDAGPGDTYVWNSFPQVDIDDPKNRYINVPGRDDTITYMVKVWEYGCLDSAYKVVAMYPASKYGIPNAFSPNGDTYNDVLYVRGSGIIEMTLRIYNRYGQPVFETTNPKEGWDGTTNGQRQEQEVYTYYLKILFADGSYAEDTGNITLMR